MLWTALVIYVISLFVVRRTVVGSGEESIPMFFFCVIPGINTVVAFVFTVLWVIENTEDAFVKVANWFFNKKD